MSPDIALARYPQLDRISGFLAAIGAQGIRHGDRTLFEHLVGTASCLIVSGAAEEVVYAGLCHSVYGTPSFSRKLLRAEDRWQLQSLLGERAEELVWNYSTFVACKVEAGRDLCSHEPLMQIAIANQMDILDAATAASQETST